LHQIADAGRQERVGLKLFGREIIFEEFQHNMITVPKRYGRTDSRTDRRHTVASSRGKNV